MNRLASALSAAVVALAAAPSFGAFVIVGSLQTEQGNPSDWSPETSTLVMNNVGGVHSYSVSNLANGTSYEFKILDDGGTPPAAWTDTEVTFNNIKLFGDADGTATITANANVLNNQSKPTVWVNYDGGPLQVVGDFMNEAGGAGDWNPSNPAFAMTSQGNGYYVFNAVISTPGSYQFKITDGTGWNFQIGTDGFTNNSNTFAFSTTAPNETVTLFADLAGGSIGVVPEPASAALLALGGLAMLKRRTA